MDGKKISFSFIKTKTVEKTLKEEPKEYIASVENNTIKVIDAKNTQSNLPLSIKPRPEVKKSIMNMAETAEDNENVKKEHEKSNTLDQMAVEELLAEAKKEIKVQTKELSVPISVKNNEGGAQESTLDDYEIIPVQGFGMALLRGMGWNPNQKTTNCKLPEIRPNRLGLGAGKSPNIKENQKALALKSFVKVTSGKYSDFYGKVISINEDTNRVVVQLKENREMVSLNEFMVQTVTEYEYYSESRKISKTLNSFHKKELSSCPSLIVTEDLTAIPGTSKEITKSKKVVCKKVLKTGHLYRKRRNECDSSPTNSSD